MSKCFVVYPEGDFDGNAVLIEAETPEEAALAYFQDGNDGPFSCELNLRATVCVLPFVEVKEYRLKVEVAE